MAVKRCKETTLKHNSVLSMLKLVIVVACQSWKNDARVMENHGKIMEFDSGKALGTLNYPRESSSPKNKCLQVLPYRMGLFELTYKI